MGFFTLVATLITMLPLAQLGLAVQPALADTAISDPHFQATWAYTDQVVASQQVNRTWMWGPQPNGAAIVEPYWDSLTGWRLVQYFDKTRMEITNPGGDQSSIWYVTNGLLAKELITGDMQIGDDKFVQYAPAQVNVAGDANDPNGPTYATFNTLMSLAANPDGSTITQTVNRSGALVTDSSLASYGVTAQNVGSLTNHTVASVFWDFMNSTGLVEQNGQTSTGQLFQNPFYATGYPLTEPYWTHVLVGGVQKLVLVQVFERRVLTYTPDNSDGWKVEAGNVGQHYYTWRYTQLQQVAMPVQDLNTTPASVHSCGPSNWNGTEPQADLFYGQHVTLVHQETHCRVFNAQDGVWWDQALGTVTVYAGNATSGTPLDTQPETDFMVFHEPSDFWGGAVGWNTSGVQLLYDHRSVANGWENTNSTSNNTWSWEQTADTNPPQSMSGSFPGHPMICPLDSWTASSQAFGMSFSTRLDPNSLAGAPTGTIPYVFDVTGVNLDTIDLVQAVTLPPGATLGHFQTGNCLFVYMNPASAAGQYTVILKLPDGRHMSTAFDFLPAIGAASGEGSVEYKSTMDDLNTYAGTLATNSVSDGVENIQATGFGDDGGWANAGAKRADFGDSSVSLDVRQVTAGGSSNACLDARALFAGAKNDYLVLCLLSSGETVAQHRYSSNGAIYYATLFDRAARPGTNPMTDWNTLKIVSKGDVAWFYINDTLVGSAQLAAQDQGTIGFSVTSTGDSPMSWQFRNLVVKSLQ
jgi:hypothetical protein